MTRFVSLLRGINVGGHRKVPMAPLRSVYAELGLESISSYIQSGNVVFTAHATTSERLRGALQQAIAERFGFEVGVLVRDAGAWSTLMAQLPYDRAEADADDRRYLVALLSAPAEDGSAARLEAEAVPPERLRVVGDCVYLHCPNGQAGSRLGLGLIEKRLDRVATVRNWRTVSKLRSLIENG